jgi:CRP/FNR family cyclic AMP-dependent transcriptional regulator
MPRPSNGLIGAIANHGGQARDLISRVARSTANNATDRLKDLLLRHLPEEHVEEILGHHTTLTYAKGTIIFLQGAPADVVYWIRAGLVGIYYPDAEGNRILVQLAGPGEFVGHTDFVDEKGRLCQAFEAHTRANTQLALVTRDHLHKVLNKLGHEAVIGLLQQLNTAWSSAMGRWVQLISLSFRQRLELILSELASRFGVEDARGTMLLPQLTHADLAEMIGSSRPMVSRILADMIEHGVLTQHSGHYIIARGTTLDQPFTRAWPSGTGPKPRTGGHTERAA